MRVALTIGNVDASSWDLQGEMGYWIGVGFGTTAMAGSDIVLCQFRHTGNNNVDKFLCSDRKSSGRSMPVEDAEDNVDDIETIATYATVNGKQIATLKATFDRLLDTLDITNDFKIRQSSTIDAIWAHGQILGNTVQMHGGNSAGGRGVVRMFIPSLNGAFGFGVSMLAVLLCSVFAILLY